MATSVNRRQVRVPARLWDEVMLALNMALDHIEELDEPVDRPDVRPVVSHQVLGFGRRLLTEARRRERDPHNEPRPS